MAESTVSIADILGRPGASKELRLAAEVPGVTTALAHLAPRPVQARLRADSVVEGILVTGTVAATAQLECARCLKEFESSLTVDVCELFVAPGHEETADEDAYRVTGQEVDLEPMMRDAVALALPLNPVCEAACKGLCARCGKDLSEGPCECSEDDMDPRWAALAVLKERIKEG